MAYLFDTDAISELFKPKPASRYLDWVAGLTRSEQFTSAVVIADLFKGAYRTRAQGKYLAIVEDRVLPQFTVLPFDTEIARAYGRIRATLETAGTPVADADLMIAATARRYGLTVVTGNIRHFSRVPDLAIDRTFSDSRS